MKSGVSSILGVTFLHGLDDCRSREFSVWILGLGFHFRQGQGVVPWTLIDDGITTELIIAIGRIDHGLHFTISGNRGLDTIGGGLGPVLHPEHHSGRGSGAVIKTGDPVGSSAA